MKRRRFFNTAGEKRKFYNNLRYFGQTRNLGIACLGLLPVLGIIGLVIMCAIAVVHFGNWHVVTAVKGHRALGTAVAGTFLTGYPKHKQRMSLKQALCDYERAQENLLQVPKGLDGKMLPELEATYQANQNVISDFHAKLKALGDEENDYARSKTPVKPENNPGGSIEVLPKATFATMAEQLQAVAKFSITRGASRDPRLVAIGSREYDAIMNASGIKAAAGMNESVPAEGGFLLQADTADGILERVYDTGQLIPYCNTMEISSPSNRLKFNAIDEVSRCAPLYPRR